MRRSYVVAALVVLGALLGGHEAFAQAGAPATWSATDCQGCHEKAVNPVFAKTGHAKLAESCARCHQNVAEHAKAQMSGDAKGPVPSMKALSAQQITSTCLECHEKDGQANYHSSAHDRRNVACTACHSVHSPKTPRAQLKTAVEADLCYSCHKSQRSKSMRTSHHPIREGKMSCSSCHNPHDGSQPAMLKADSVNELCYTCHTEKRGPFLFEHAAVREDCASCHDPHGSNHRRLLVKKMPNLCWDCHFTGSGHFGSGDNFSTEKGVPVAPTGAPSGFPTVNSRFVEKACANCHIAVHGSNAPSGAYLVR